MASPSVRRPPFKDVDDATDETTPLIHMPSQIQNGRHPSSPKHHLFFKDGRRQIDFVLAYRETTDDATWKQSRAEKRRIFEDNLTKFGVELEYEHESNDKKTHFVKLHIPFKVATRCAEALLMRMPIQISENTIQSTEERCIEKVCCGANPFRPHLDAVPDEYTAIFQESKGASYLGWDDPTSFFTEAQRSRICHDILSKISYGRDATKVGVDRLLGNKTYTAAYPLHSGPYETHPGSRADNERSVLYREWGRWGAWYKSQPLDNIRCYFGEKIAIYFAWLGYYTSMLFLPSALGLLVFIIGVLTAYSGGGTAASRELCGLDALQEKTPECNLTSVYDGRVACRDVLMCPLCSTDCDYWLLSSGCGPNKAGSIFDNGATVFFACFMALWATFFLEFWKRRQSEIAFDWDLTEFEEEEERPRAQFEAKLKGKKKRANPVTGIEEPYQESHHYYSKIMAALSVVIFFVTLVIGVLFSIIIYRLAVGELLFKAYGAAAVSVVGVLASILQVISIMVLNKLYTYLAMRLTDWELHRTGTEHEDSFTFKMFVFQFCNFYGSIFYIAFFKGNFAGHPPHYTRLAGFRMEECGAGGCLVELTTQLAMIMVANQAINNFVELVLPRVKIYFAKRDNKETRDKQLSQWEEDYDLNEIPEHGLFSEYLEMVIQFGFVSLFVAAFPLAPIFALINNLIEIRLDAQKMLTQIRRPYAERAEDIGIWYGCLSAVTYLAVVTNAFVIAFTTDFIPQLVYRSFVDDKINATGFWRGENDTVDGYNLYRISFINVSVLEEFSHNRGQLENSSVKFNYLRDHSVAFDADNLTCGYRGPKRTLTGHVTMYYWSLIAGRLAFVIAFEHVVFVVKGFIAWLVPDIPKRVQLEMQRENFHNKRKLRDLGV